MLQGESSDTAARKANQSALPVMCFRRWVVVQVQYRFAVLVAAVSIVCLLCQIKTCAKTSNKNLGVRLKKEKTEMIRTSTQPK